MSRDELVEPDSIEAGMLVSDLLEDPLPDRRVKSGLFGAARQRLARQRRLHEGHGVFFCERSLKIPARRVRIFSLRTLEAGSLIKFLQTGQLTNQTTYK